jgi:hypothetical protein
MPAKQAETPSLHASFARPGRFTMRPHSVIATTAILIAGFGVTLFSFSRPTAEGVKSPSRDISQTREPAQLPIQKIHDMSVVFSQGD